MFVKEDFIVSKNVTIRLDDTIIKKCRHAAVEEDKSLSKWIADTLTDKVSEEDQTRKARSSALKRLEAGFSLGGTPLTREEIYAE